MDLNAQVPQGPQVQHMIIQEPVTDPDEDPTVESLIISRTFSSS